MSKFTLTLSIKEITLSKIHIWFEKHAIALIIAVLSIVSIFSFVHYLSDGTALAYNDARSHLDIARRVVEGLKPGFAQIGSVWLPLPHVLMIPTIWNDFMWHTGLSGALQSMLSFVATGVVIYLFLKKLGTSLFARFFGVFLFVANINVLYLQSTPMTELLLLVTMTAGVYFLMKWHGDEKLTNLILAALLIMLSTLIRYDGWFLLLFATGLIFTHALRKGKGFSGAEGSIFFFGTLAGLGVVLWFLWNLLIFKDPFYFAFGPFSAHAQQQLIESAGQLPTKGNWFLSTKIYLYAFLYNTYTLPAIIGLIGMVVLWFDKRIKKDIRIASLALLAPLCFNIVALYLGHSVLFIAGISGNTWFNARYGMMVIPSFAILAAYAVDRVKNLKVVIAGILVFVLAFAFINGDAVTIDDARVGASQKNVTEVSGYLAEHVNNEEGFVLISAASHDAVIFSSGLPMKRFIHEGTGKYWENAIEHPDQWAKWIILRKDDDSDLTWRKIHDTEGFANFERVKSYPFADIYELKPEYQSGLITQPIIAKP